MDLNYLIQQQIKQENLEEVEIKLNEIQAITLADVYGFKYKKCAKEMKISIDEFNDIITSTRKKISTALIQGNTIKIIYEESIESMITTLCKFRCAVCGEIYTVDYKVSEILCPLCFSSNIMTNKEAGFCKK